MNNGGKYHKYDLDSSDVSKLDNDRNMSNGKNVSKAKWLHSSSIPIFKKSGNEFKEPQKFSKKKYEISISDINKIPVPLVME